MAHLLDHHRVVRETHDRIHAQILDAYISSRTFLAAQQSNETHQITKPETSERAVACEPRSEPFLPATQQNNADVHAGMSGTDTGPLPEERRPGRPLGSVAGTSTSAPRTKLKALANHPHTHKGKAVKRILQDYPAEDEVELQDENFKTDTRLMTLQEVQEWFQKILATTPPKPDDHGRGCLLWTGALLKNNAMPNVSLPDLAQYTGDDIDIAEPWKVSKSVSPKLHEGLKWNAQFKVHRIAYVAYHGKDIRGYVSQLCGDQRCINGAHLVDEGAKKHVVRTSHPEGTCKHEPECIQDRDGRYMNES